jgi:hypothetical protein
MATPEQPDPGPVHRRGEPGELAESQLRNNPYLALKNVTCACRDVTLVLRGCLPTNFPKQVALASVGGIAGVVRVVDEIEVRAPGAGVVRRD